MLYERHNYLNKSIEYLISNEIIEYDIKSAGFNLIKKYKLLSDDKINYLESLSRESRHINIGLFEKNDTDFKKKLNEKFVEIRKVFFEANNIQDDEVLSIKKDAIFMLRRCQNTMFDNIEFVEKNIYTSYYYLNNIEFYVNNDGISIKGISDDKLEFHKDYMVDFLFKFFKMLETVSNKNKIIKELTDFSYYYKNKKLVIGYYRELNKDSMFKLNQKFNNQLIGIVNTNDMDCIDITYNYMNYIVPLINILV